MFLIHLRKLKVNMPWYFYYWLKCNKYSNISKGRAGSTTGKNLKALITWALWSKRCQYRCKVGPKGANENMKGYILLHGLETGITNNDLLYSTGSSTSVFCNNGKMIRKRMDICICITEPLCFLNQYLFFKPFCDYKTLIMWIYLRWIYFGKFT